MNIYDELLKPIDRNPHNNYDTVMKFFQHAQIHSCQGKPERLKRRNTKIQMHDLRYIKF